MTATVLVNSQGKAYMTSDNKVLISPSEGNKVAVNSSGKAYMTSGNKVLLIPRTSNTVTVYIYIVQQGLSGGKVTIGEQTFSNLVTGETYTYEATIGESYTLYVTRPQSTLASISDSNGNKLANESYTFTATEDVTYRVRIYLSGPPA